MKKTFIFFVLFILGVFCSCSNKNDVEQASKSISATEDIFISEPSQQPTSTPEPTEDLTNKAVNILTGDYVDKEIASRRPVAVVINNLHKALPQSGLSKADIFYEVLAEGGITRIITVFKDFTSTKIGPVRSSRHYFLDFALDNDAIFVHHGGSPQAYEAIKSLKVNNIDGMKWEGTTFWRDPVRVKQKGMYEHSSYTSGEKILQTIDKIGYRTDLTEDFIPPFNFYNTISYPAQGQLVNKVTIPFSDSQKSIFIYDFKNNLFNRFQGSEKHIDEETGEQLSVTNILIQYTKIYTIAGDTAGRREVELVGKGNGVLITNGHYTNITWKKASHNSPTEWYDENGEKLYLNKGKTWICVFQQNGKVIFE